MGLCGTGVLSIRFGIPRHDDLGRLRKPERSASPQRLRRARDHRDSRGLQQIQDRLGENRRNGSRYFAKDITPRATFDSLPMIDWRRKARMDDEKWRAPCARYVVTKTW